MIQYRAPVDLSLSNGDIHVWLADLYQSRPSSALLSPDEQERAKRFRFEKDRCNFVARRTLLRLILARYLRIHPASVQFRYGPNGKPELRHATGCELCFSQSHSGSFALYAMARGFQIGIDLEEVRQIPEIGQVVRQICSLREAAAFGRLPAEDQRNAFFQIWTAKEAFVKATGLGLSHLLQSFEVVQDPGGELLHVVSADRTDAQFDGWRILPFAPAKDYLAALAAETFEIRLSYWRWSD